MIEVTVFEYPGCPYCVQARKIVKELLKEHPEYSEIKFSCYDEVHDPEITDQYDYYYAPSLYLGREKLYEAAPDRSEKEARAMLDEVFAELIERE